MSVSKDEDLKEQLLKANERISKQQQMIDDLTVQQSVSEGTCVSLYRIVGYFREVYFLKVESQYDARPYVVSIFNQMRRQFDLLVHLICRNRIGVYSCIDAMHHIVIQALYQ